MFFLQESFTKKSHIGSIQNFIAQVSSNNSRLAVSLILSPASLRPPGNSQVLLVEFLTNTHFP